jgi:Putative peptidoglycan binding domain
MPTQHVVKKGECLASIAHRYGFRDHMVIYDHADNAAFKSKRPSPHLIHPGDILVIPDKEVMTVTCKTGQVHSFQVRVKKKDLKIRLVDHDGDPRADEDYELEYDDDIVFGKTDGDGRLEERLPLDVNTAVLTIGQHAFRLDIGALNPLDDVDDEGVTGIQARLRNLGFDAGDVDSDLGPMTRYALAAFQDRHGLEVTGGLNPKTVDKLKDEHGC